VAVVPNEVAQPQSYTVFKTSKAGAASTYSGIVLSVQFQLSRSGIDTDKAHDICLFILTYLTCDAVTSVSDDDGLQYVEMLTCK
jgi:hypothetical protein